MGVWWWELGRGKGKISIDGGHGVLGWYVSR